ncbi:MAG: hypothetical protein M1827_007426 [Pycnora praestabilis]|nr:MAG: hypothetical protein M1827_007426 [Pycnora praestabilis]
MLFILVMLFGVSIAQRPSTASICDFYAESLYGTNSSDTQFQLVQRIVALAFGGAFNLSNVSSDITGILNPGNFQGLNVDLQPWFNGSLESTNLNDQAVGVDWLDNGGLNPLYDFLSNATPNVILSNTTNQGRLFSRFFVDFAGLFGCSDPPPYPASSKAPVNLAYVHKYMNLNYTDIGYFIDQFGKATTYFGFSDQDSLSLTNQLTGTFNVRCAPPNAQNSQLESLCQASNCPLYPTNPDCAAYVNLTADGVVSGVASSQLSTATSSISGTTFATSTSSSVSHTTSPAGSSSTSTTSAKLTGGAIAGIAIGGAAALLLAISMTMFVARKRKQTGKDEPEKFHGCVDMFAGYAQAWVNRRDGKPSGYKERNCSAPYELPTPN